jgi:hypothetical protein
MIQHRTGAGVELRADGTMILKTEANMITAVNGSSSVIIEGDIQMSAKNFTIDVASDFNVKVGGNMSVAVAGNLSENVNGSRRENIFGNAGSIVKGNKSTTVVGSTTSTTLGSYNNIAKGDLRHTAEGSGAFVSKGALKVSSEAETNMSSPSVNIAGSSLSLFGATGTVGGAGVVMYGKGATFGEGITAPTFHGDLDGVAQTSRITRSQTYDEASTGNAGDAITNTATPSTALPTASLLDSYLNKSGRGVSKISIDAGDHIKNMIDLTIKTGGVSDRPLTQKETSVRMLDPDNASNTDFVQQSIASGNLSSSYASSSPPAINRVRSSESYCRVPTSFVSGSNYQAPVKSYAPAEKPPIKVFSVDPAYDPMATRVEITPNTLLAKGVPLATFLGGTADKVTLAHIQSYEERQAIIRNLLPQAEIIKFVQNDKGQFRDYRLSVVSGLYKLGPAESVTAGSDKDLATKGRRVIYDLIGPDGKSSPDKIYELADYLADVVLFEKMSLVYDTFNPSGTLSGLLSITMPNITTTYQVLGSGFKNQLETLFNGKVQSASDLIEITPQ